MTTVHAFIAAHSIPCDALRCDTVDVFYDQAQWDKARESAKLMQKLMPKHPAARFTFHDTAETAEKFHCPSSLGSLSYEAGSLSAYALTIGVLKLGLEKGLNLQTNTPATHIERVDGRWTVDTPRGQITTPTLILATNGYTAHLLPSLQGVIVPYRGIVTAQRPGLSLPQTGLSTTYSFVYEKGYEYMITRPAGSKNEGDVVIGGGLTKAAEEGVGEYGNTDDTALDGDIVEYLTGCTKNFLGPNWGQDHEEGRIRHVHSGIMGYSGDGYPLVGPVPEQPGLWIDASFQGHGMVLCFLCARALSEMVLGTDEEKQLDEWFPNAFKMTEERFGHVFKGRGQGLMKKTTAMNGTMNNGDAKNGEGH
jgi:glycine/D-amino acid oxidase-like deaminating enzyme